MQMQKGERTRASGLSLSLSLSLSLALFLSSKRRFQEPLREERKAISNVRKAAKDTKVKGRMKRTKEGGREGGRCKRKRPDSQTTRRRMPMAN